MADENMPPLDMLPLDHRPFLLKPEVIAVLAASVQLTIAIADHRRQVLLALLKDDSDEEEEDLAILSALRKRKRPNVDRGRRAGHERLMADYFDECSVYDEKNFRRRFRMSRVLFLRIADSVLRHNSYYEQRTDCTGLVGFSHLQKVTAAIRMLAYGSAADALDDYIRMAESTSLEALRQFCTSMVEIFGERYLRKPSLEDQQRLYDLHSVRGFPGMLGSLDCMHWRWKNCPKAWAGQFAGKEKEPTVVLEVVADAHMWIWHHYFGVSGTHNDLSILNSSSLFQDSKSSCSLPFTFDNNSYERGYYLVDGIYPAWATLIAAFRHPSNPQRAQFSKRQEGARKDVERAFGRLQAKWHIIQRPCRLWDLKHIGLVMRTCLILHNMTIEDEKEEGYDGADAAGDMLDSNDSLSLPDALGGLSSVATRDILDSNNSLVAELARHYKSIQDADIRDRLRESLVRHQWSLRSVLHHQS